MARRAARVDGNHAELRQQARACGMLWVDTFRLGEGAPDAFVCWRGAWCAVEVKDPTKPPSKRRLTDDELEWHEHANAKGAPVAVVHDIQELMGIWGD